MPGPIDPGLNEVAAALAALRPNSPAIDRDRLLFRAGRASAPRPWIWRAATAVSTLLAASLGAVLICRPAAPPVEIERVVYVHDQTPPAPAPPKREEPTTTAPAESEPLSYPWRAATPYTRLEDNVLRWGLDGLAEPTPQQTEPPATFDSLLKSF
jgi:hypothetical protein